MNQTIIILKKDLEENPDVSHYLSGVSVRVKELENACAYVPLKNAFVDIILMLNEYKIAFFMSSEQVDTFG
ncbi:hypothetical protein GXP67_34090 [Rhodocytophaga rosea]|uniref:Uncharacterized protein n=1 Tax=Rhodocytophaga rosea TaxID=2704465 RepID=A0A6C0GVJ2_9BACT|nr:hypothetical protein [Rhodocytophaga rosea]QHT71332.1 hypothetical protein GXP67_34090 [Rhodocytophaga rosea]